MLDLLAITNMRKYAACADSESPGTRNNTNVHKGFYGGPGGHASCQWLSRITPVLTPPTVVTSQCALRNAAVLAVVVIPVQCPYRRLPGFTWCLSCSRHSSQVSVAYLVMQRTIHACALEHARVRLTANPETQASMLALICVAVILLIPQCVALSRDDPQVDSEFERQSN